MGPGSLTHFISRIGVVVPEGKGGGEGGKEGGGGEEGARFMKRGLGFNGAIAYIQSTISNSLDHPLRRETLTASSPLLLLRGVFGSE